MKVSSLIWLKLFEQQIIRGLTIHGMKYTYTGIVFIDIIRNYRFITLPYSDFNKAVRDLIRKSNIAMQKKMCT